MKLLTPELVAEALAVSRSTAMRMIAEGVIPAVCLRSGRRKKSGESEKKSCRSGFSAKKSTTATANYRRNGKEQNVSDLAYDGGFGFCPLCWRHDDVLAIEGLLLIGAGYLFRVRRAQSKVAHRWVHTFRSANPGRARTPSTGLLLACGA